MDQTLAASREATFDRVVAILRNTTESLAPDEALTPDTGLLGRGIGLDSIDVLALVTAIEEAFDLTVEDDELAVAHFRTVGTLAAFVHEQLPRG